MTDQDLNTHQQAMVETLGETHGRRIQNERHRCNDGDDDVKSLSSIMYL